MSKPKKPHSHPDYHWIWCDCCMNRKWVRKALTRLCEECFKENGDSDRVPWGEVNEAVTNYLAKEGIPLMELVPSGKWKE